MAKYYSDPNSNILHVNLTNPEEIKIFRAFLEPDENGDITCSNCNKSFNLSSESYVLDIPNPLNPQTMFDEVIAYPNIICKHCHCRTVTDIVSIDRAFPEVVAVLKTVQEKAIADGTDVNSNGGK